MPTTPETGWPASGDVCEAPWISWMRTGGVAVVKLHDGLPATLSGGSSVSWSETWPPNTVTVHVSAVAKSASGFSVNVVGPPLTVAVCAPLEPHEIEYHVPLTFTGSLNVIETLLLTSTPVAPEAGFVLATVGAASEGHVMLIVSSVRGFGAPTAKSEALLSVSTQPSPARKTAVVFDGAGVAPAPSKKFAFP
jgi:hypothetical protein